ncbi:MAG: hypothetical protein AAF389_01655 [Gemmatimonadota bacterium]
MQSNEHVDVSITIDTEEDDWDSYAPDGKSVGNILRLPDLQEVFDRWGARPTYLVNYAPLVDAGAVETLGALAARDDVEIGAHLHPWCTPPITLSGEDNSFMRDAPADDNRAKLATVVGLISSELGVQAKSFRAGRWGFGPTVSSVLADVGIEVDSSVSPLTDWRRMGGPDFTGAPLTPYRFSPADPVTPRPNGELAQLPPTVGFLSGDDRARQAIRAKLEASFLSKFKLVGIADRAGLLTRRWLSPELSSAGEMIRLAEGCVRRGRRFLNLTFHSGILLPGATPFVSDEDDRARFLAALDHVLGRFQQSGYRFRTLLEASRDPATFV